LNLNILNTLNINGDNLLLKLINKVACLFKGPGYKIDSALPVSELISYSTGKIMALVRCQLRGVVI
tara:strand:- start:872 stop:1069 length:198 start_codon:yes stop_codon:yes gene_type:complete